MTMMLFCEHVVLAILKLDDGKLCKKEISADDKKPWFLRYIFPVQSFDVWAPRYSGVSHGWCPVTGRVNLGRW